MTRFKLKYSIKDISIYEEEINFELKLTHQIQIKLSKPSEDYIKRSKANSLVFCEAELSIKPSTKNQKLLENIINGSLIIDETNLSAPYSQSKNSEGKEIIIPGLHFFPGFFQEFIGQINNELSEASKRTINTIRWYFDNRGSHNPFAFIDFKWTNDNENWYSVPISIYFSVESGSNYLKINEDEKLTILNLLENENDEPIFHSLWREAWGLRNQNNRSALIMAISAIEVSVKKLVERIIPDATWLVTKLQSPPIHSILKDYIPNLKIDNYINGVQLLPTENMLRDLKKWVNIRNELAHLGKKSLNGLELEEMLLTIKDILHIIDYNCGHKWALKHIRKSTLKLIGIEKPLLS